MDVLYFLKHSRCDDLEIRFSLRSVAQNFPDAGKVWIFGDCPAFLSDDKTLVEHVPHDYIASLLGFRTPITNFFQLQLAASLIPELSQEYLWFCDDFMVLSPLTMDAARTVRYLEDLDQVQQCRSGLWLDSLWRTYDILKREGYPRLNYETHVPTYFRRKWVLDAYNQFCDWVTHDRFLGMLGPTAILNHAHANGRFQPVDLLAEMTRAGFYKKTFHFEDIEQTSTDKLFMSFDDHAFNPNMLRFLLKHFPAPCRFEKHSDLNEMNGLPTAEESYLQTVAYVGR
ncbi:hypothetical protein RMSM_05461 [Rhodopirellula maiorica SM1]|uniref:Uncharacterized protein n=1 Tax=Rhodopirellula maiorica SM1 TaxID=1265738 RepID=M5RDR4_9BACT|nr:hypothetical protein [Rhodopirellula maiorica]EMI17618.1 hypothetical protein RMSM_05461 [Rhodopirellula maiorica SM1]